MPVYLHFQYIAGPKGIFSLIHAFLFQLEILFLSEYSLQERAAYRYHPKRPEPIPSCTSSAIQTWGIIVESSC